VDRAAARVLQGVRAPDVVVNNAGLFGLKPFLETSTQEFVRQVAATLTGPFLILKALLPAMVQRGSGHVVTIGSVADHVALPGNTAYAAAKFGLRGMHQVVAAELARQGIRATLISPGPTDTPLWDPLDPDHRADLPNRAEMLLPQDVAEVVLFVVSRSARVNIELVRLAAAPVVTE
jgi:NAD(P)-dependent dehydrogenase (short-subunit alcohol dehydrogenase family)